MLARVNSVALAGVEALPVEVEVDMSPGLPALSLVGLPEAAVREARDRVRAALTNSGYQIPARRITINLAPADLPKEGSAYDLPMAMGMLVAMGRLPPELLAERLFIGELALDGRLKPIPGCLPTALHASRKSGLELVVPAENAAEAALVPGLAIIAAPTLLDLVRHLLGEDLLTPPPPTDWNRWPPGEGAAGVGETDLSEVKGQEYVKRAMEVAAAGGHNLLMSGPPGSGKTMMARCLPGILPPLTLDQALEVAALYSISGRLGREHAILSRRPFRSPHHTASHVAIIGGGNNPRPGEVSLAHHGILFLDELPEFDRRTLEVLREPLEAGEVIISRAARSNRFPAQFQLVAACNPCPCGHLGNAGHRCRCLPQQVERYRNRLSGPLLDRIDLHVEVPAVPHEELVSLPGGERSQVVRERVVAARAVQAARNGHGLLNAHLNGKALERETHLDDGGRRLLLAASKRLNVSARGYHRILRVARTIADLASCPAIGGEHLSEAIQFRVGGLMHRES